MNVFSLFGRIALDDKDYQAGLKRAEGETTKASRNMEESLKKVGEQFTKTGKALTVGLTAPIVAVATAAIASTRAVGNYADRILDLADMTGLSTDRLQAFEQVAIQAGVSTDTLANSARALTMRLSATGDESKGFSDAMKALRIETRNADGSLRSMDDLLPEVIRNLASIEDVTTRNAIATEVFGRSALDLAPVLSLGADAIENITEETIRMGNIMSIDALKAANDLRIQQEQLQKSIKDTWREISIALIPVVSQIVTLINTRALPAFQRFVEITVGLIERFQALDSWQKTALGGLAIALAAAGPLMVGLGNLLIVLPKITAALAALRTGVLLALGPAGWIALLITGLVSLGFYLAGRENSITNKINQAIDATNRMGHIMAGVTNRESLQARVKELAATLDGEAKQSFINLAEQALASGKDISQIVDELDEAYFRLHNRIRLAEVAARVARERDRERVLLERLADAQEEITRQTILIEEALRRQTPYEEGFLLNAENDAQLLLDKLQEVGEELARLAAEEQALLGRSPERLARLAITPTVTTPGAAPGLAPIYNAEADALRRANEERDDRARALLAEVALERRLRETRADFEQVGLSAADITPDDERQRLHDALMRRLALEHEARTRVNAAIDAAVVAEQNYQDVSLGAAAISAEEEATNIRDFKTRQLLASARAYLDLQQQTLAASAAQHDYNMAGLEASPIEQARLQRQDEINLRLQEQAAGLANNADLLEDFADGQANAAKRSVDSANAYLRQQRALALLGDETADVYGALEQQVIAMERLLDSLDSTSDGYLELARAIKAAKDEMADMKSLTPEMQRVVLTIAGGINKLAADFGTLAVTTGLTTDNVLKSFAEMTLGVIQNIIQQMLGLQLLAAANAIMAGLTFQWWRIAGLIAGGIAIAALIAQLRGTPGVTGPAPAPIGTIAGLEERRRVLVTERETATSESEISRINQEILAIEAEIRRLRELGLGDTDMPGAPGAPDAPQAPTGPREITFGQTAPMIQLAVATPLVEASRVMLDAANIMRETFGSMMPGQATGFGSIPPFTDAIARMTPVLERLLVEGVQIRQAPIPTTGGTSLTAALRSI